MSMSKKTYEAMTAAVTRAGERVLPQTHPDDYPQVAMALEIVREEMGKAFQADAEERGHQFDTNRFLGDVSNRRLAVEDVKAWNKQIAASTDASEIARLEALKIARVTKAFDLEPEAARNAVPGRARLVIVDCSGSMYLDAERLNARAAEEMQKGARVIGINSNGVQDFRDCDGKFKIEGGDGNAEAYIEHYQPDEIVYITDQLDD